MERLQLKLAAASNAGRRARQEDSHLTASTASGAVLAVADGMGGHASGEVASRLAVEALAVACRQSGAVADPRALLAGAAEAANRAILDHAAHHGESEGLGTTLVAAAVGASGAVLGHAGDSRAWLVTPDDVVQITRDHSAVQDALDRGTMNEAEAAHSPYRHAVLRSLGDTSFPGLEYTPPDGWLALPSGSVLLLTSDGAHGFLTPADLLEHIAGTPTLDQALDNLVRLAFHRGSDDNITIVGCEVGRFPRSRAAAQTPPPIRRAAPAIRRRARLVPVLLTAGALAALAGLSAALVRSLGGRPARVETSNTAPVRPAPTAPATPAGAFATPIPKVPPPSPTPTTTTRRESSVTVPWVRKPVAPPATTSPTERPATPSPHPATVTTPLPLPIASPVPTAAAPPAPVADATAAPTPAPTATPAPEDAP